MDKYDVVLNRLKPQANDIANLVESMCCDESSTVNISALNSLLIYCHSHAVPISKEKLKEKCVKIVEVILKNEEAEVTFCFQNLLVNCFQLLPVDDCHEIIKKLADSIIKDNSETEINHCLQLLVALLPSRHGCHITQIVLNQWTKHKEQYSNPFIKKLYNFLIKCLKDTEVYDQFFNKVIDTSMNCILNMEESMLEDNLHLAEFLINVLSIYVNNNKDQSPSPQSSSLSKYNLFESNIIWKVLQNGICDKRTYIRKQSVFILKKWIWIQDFIKQSSGDIINHKCAQELTLIIESLEENQIHVLRPIFKVFLQLFNAVDKTASLNLLKSSLHPSWILCVFSKIFNHESK